MFGKIKKFIESGASFSSKKKEPVKAKPAKKVDELKAGVNAIKNNKTKKAAMMKEMFPNG